MERRIDKRSVIEEEPLSVRIEATRGRLPLPPGWIDEPLLPEPVRLGTGRSRARVRVDVTFARRGRRVLAPPALVLRDPFGLAQRVIPGDRTDEVLVLPQVLPVRATAGGGDGITAHARAALIAAAETEIDGLREHREGSPASRIHWPSVARGAGLMERKLISEADSRPLVVLDPRAPADDDALDAAVRAAASLTVHFARKTRLRAAAPRRPARDDGRPRPARLADRARAARAARRDRPARRSPPRRTAAGSSSSSPRAWSTGRRAGSGARPAAACSSCRGRSPNRRAVLEVAGCQGFVAGRTGSAAVMAAVGAAA